MRTKLFVVLSILLALPLMGQTMGEITGRVTDPTAAGVPDAVLTLTSMATNAARQTTTTSDGDYSFPSVPPGIYKAKVEHPGFKITTINNIEVQVQQTVGAAAQSLIDFPPMQQSASFNLAAVKEKIEQMMKSHEGQ